MTNDTAKIFVERLDIQRTLLDEVLSKLAGINDRLDQIVHRLTALEQRQPTINVFTAPAVSYPSPQPVYPTTPYSPTICCGDAASRSKSQSDVAAILGETIRQSAVECGVSKSLNHLGAEGAPPV